MNPGLKALFVHDHTFSLNSSGYVFSSGGLPATTWNRYLKHFSKLTVMGRVSQKIISPDYESQMVLSSSDDVDFVFNDNASNLKSLLTGGGTARKKMARVVSDHDVVISRLTSELGLLAIKEARKQGKPWAVELVDCPWDSYWNYGGLIARFYAPIISLRVKLAMASSSHSLYVTKEFLQKRYPSKNAVSISCSNVEIPDADKAVLQQRKLRIEFSNEKVVFAQVASLTGRFKGIQVALEAVSKIRKYLPGIEYRVLGGGDVEPWLKEAKKFGVDDICFFDGSLPSGEEVYKWLDQADIYIHPSYKEGLPRALIEAMSRGCPAIASKVAGIPELLSEKMMMAAGDSDALAEKMLGLAANKKDQELEAEKNFYIAKGYTAELLNNRRYSFWRKFSQDAIK